MLICGANFLHNTTRPSSEITASLNNKIDHFHERLMEGKFSDIYADADAELKSKHSETEFTVYLQKAQEKFGNEMPRANVNSQESLINTLKRKLGKPVVQLESITIAEKPNYQSEVFRWVIYRNDE